MHPRTLTHVARNFGASCLALAWFSFLGGAAVVQDLGVGTEMLSWLLKQWEAYLMFSLVAYGISFGLRRKMSLPELPVGPELLLAFSMALGGVLLGTYRMKSFHFFTQPNLMFYLVPLALALGLLLYLTKGISNRALLPIAVALVCVGLARYLAFEFQSHALGRMLFSDDHPCFYYRLVLLQQYFPGIPFYNPAWNAGYSAREFFPSGTLNLFFLSLPLLALLPKFAELEGAAGYNWIVLYVLIFVVPFSQFLTGRILRLSVLSSLFLAFLALAPSRLLFEYALQYGTIPFVISSALLPLFLAVLSRFFLESESPSRWDCVLLIVVGYLAFTWHLMIIVLLPAVVFGVVQLLRSERRQFMRPLILSLFVVALLHAPSGLTLLRESQLVSLVSRDTLPGSDTTSMLSHGETRPQELTAAPEFLLDARKAFIRIAAKCHPLLVVFSIPAFLLLRSKPLARYWFSTIAWLSLLAAFGPGIKPQFELQRMLLPATLMLGPPVLLYFQHWLQAEKGRQSWVSQFALGICFATLALTPFQARAHYRNETPERFTFEPEYQQEFVEALSAYGGTGRVFFSAFILHELGASHYNTQDGGHIAHLAHFAGKPMYASHYYHVYWSSVDPIPEAYRRRGTEGIEEFLDLINASAVVSFKKEWVKYFAGNQRYTEVWKGGRFRIFTRASEQQGYVLSGAADVFPTATGVEVVPRTSEVVLKFRYFPWLELTRVEGTPLTQGELDGQPVFAEEVGGGASRQVKFIRLKDMAIGQRVRLEF